MLPYSVKRLIRYEDRYCVNFDASPHARPTRHAARYRPRRTRKTPTGAPCDADSDTAVVATTGRDATGYRPPPGTSG